MGIMVEGIGRIVNVSLNKFTDDVPITHVPCLEALLVGLCLSERLVLIQHRDVPSCPKTRAAEYSTSSCLKTPQTWLDHYLIFTVMTMAKTMSGTVEWFMFSGFCASER